MRRAGGRRPLFILAAGLLLSALAAYQMRAWSLHPNAWWVAGGLGAWCSILLALLVRAGGEMTLLGPTYLAERTQLATLLDHTNDAIIGLDPEERVTLWNQAATRMFGITPQQSLGRPLSDLRLAPDDLQDHVALMQAALAGRAAPPIETRRRRSDGEWVDVELSVSPIFDGQGRVVGVAKVMHSIKDRLDLVKRLQEHGEQLELRVAERAALHAEAETDLRAVLDAMPSMVSSWDRHHLNRFANKRYCSFFGRAPDSMRGTSLLDLLGPKLFALNKHYIDAVLEGKEQFFERDLPIQGGVGVRNSLAHYLPQWADGQVVGFYVLVHDVTDLKRAQIRLQNIIDGTQAGTWEWDVSTGEVTLNCRWAEMLGYTLQELEPITIQTWKQLVHPQDEAHSIEVLKRHFKGDTPAYECEARFRHKDGHWVWAQGRGKVVARSADGRPLHMAGTHQDISDRKAAEQALHLSKTLLARTGALARVGGWEVDIASRSLWWSDEASHIFGQPVGHQPALDESINYFAPQARAVIWGLVERCMRHGKGWDAELPAVRADGASIWLRVVGEAQLEAGRLVRLAGAYQDVTDQHLASDALHSQQQMTQIMLEAAPVAVQVTSLRDNHVRLVNERFAKLVRCSTEQAMAINIAEWFVKPDFFADIQRRLSQEEVVVDSLVELRAPDRPELAQVWVLASYMVIDHLGEPSVLAWLYDVTELKRAREDALAAQELMQEALDATQTALAIYDEQDRLEFCNPRYRDMHAEIADMLQLGTAFEDIARASTHRYPQSDRDADPEAWLIQRLATHREGGEFVRRLHDRFVRVIDRPLRGGKMASIRLDVTELALAREAAESASQAKSNFLASTSHEIRTPLNAILGLAYLLERGRLAPQEREQVRQISQAGKSLLALLNDVLDISKIEAGQFVLEALDFDLRALVRTEAALLSAGLHGRPVELRVVIGEDLPPIVRGDQTRVRQILSNLLSNALKFTLNGSVTVRLHCGAAPSWIDLQVSDTGIGIEPEVQARLFKPFEQADASTTRRFGGTGLGLAITAQLVAMMGGHIALESSLGSGSSFTVSLPLPASDAKSLPSAFDDVEPLRVLLADDDEIQLDLLVDVGRSLGWQCQAVSGGLALLEEAVAAEREGRSYDALVVDWCMPDLDGLSALTLLMQRLPHGQWPAAVVVSQHELSEMRAAPHAEIASVLLVKPVDGSKLFNAVNQSVAAMPERAARLLDASHVGHTECMWLVGLHVLVVDDSSINLEVARKVLELEGAEVTTCTGGEAALRLLNDPAARFDAALLDVQMPGMDGFELLRRLRQLPTRHELPAVALTAGVQRQEREAAVAAGMTDFLAKPLEPRRLIRCLRRHVERRRGTPIAVLARESKVDTPQEALNFGIDGIDDEAIAPSLRSDRPLMLSMIRRLLAEYADLGTVPRRDLHATIHKLRGSVGVVGATKLAAAAARLESALKLPSDEGIPELVTDLVRQLNALGASALVPLQLEAERLEFAQQERANTGAEPLTETEWAPLRTLIDQQNLRAATLVEDMAARLLASIGEASLGRLRAALQAFSFEDALNELPPGAPADVNEDQAASA